MAGIAALALLTFVFTYPLIWHTGNGVLPGDSWLNTWILAWAVNRLPHGLHGFWSPPVFFPYHDTLAYSENLLGIAPLVAPVQWLTGNFIQTYNAALIVSFVGAGVGMYLLAYEITRHRVAAALGAIAFAFTPYRAAQLGHLQVLMAGWLPLALWALHRFFRRGQPAMLAVSAAAFVLQVLSNGYAAFFMPVALLILAAFELGAQPWARIRRWAWPAALVLLAGAILLAPAIGAYRAAWHDAGATHLDVRVNSADVGTYLSVADGLPESTWLPGVSQPEGNFFPGFVAVALVVLAWLPAGVRKLAPPGEHARRARRVYTTAGVAGLLLSLGPDPHVWQHSLGVAGPYRLLELLPLVDVLRVPARFGMLVMLAVAVLVSIGAARLLTRRSTKMQMTGALVVALGMMLEATPAPVSVAPWTLFARPGTRAAYDGLARQPAGPLLQLPSLHGLEAQFGVLIHGHPIVNGVSRRESPLIDLVNSSAFPLARPSTIGQAIEPLRALGVRYVLVDPPAFADQTLGRRTLQTFDASDQVVRRATFGEVTVLELAPWTEPDPRPASPLQRVLAEDVHVTASDNSSRVGLMLDGDPDTRWLSGRPQSGNEWIDLVFDRPRPVARVDLVVTPRSTGDYPRHAVITVSTGEATVTAWQGDPLVLLAAGFRRTPEQPVIEFPLPGVPTSHIRIRQTGSTDKWYWSVDELRIWERR